MHYNSPRPSVPRQAHDARDGGRHQRSCLDVRGNRGAARIRRPATAALRFWLAVIAATILLACGGTPGWTVLVLNLRVEDYVVRLTVDGKSFDRHIGADQLRLLFVSST